MRDQGRILFVALVTCYLLGRLLDGGSSPSEIVIYALAAGFGLEFVLSSWPALWGTRGQPN